MNKGLSDIENLLLDLSEIIENHNEEIGRLQAKKKLYQEMIEEIDAKISRKEDATANYLDRKVPGWRELIRNK